MIAKLIAAITARIDRHTVREEDLLAATRQFNLALSLANIRNGNQWPVIEEITDISEAALEASYRNDIKALKDCAARLEEFI